MTADRWREVLGVEPKTIGFVHDVPHRKNTFVIEACNEEYL
jgi:hypothetical protein